MVFCTTALFTFFLFSASAGQKETLRERISINDGWRFMLYPSVEEADHLIYDIRPLVSERNDNKVADSKTTEEVQVASAQGEFKPWI